MTYADTQEAYRDARRMERYSCIGPDEQDMEYTRRDIQREKSLSDAIDEAYEEMDR